MKAVVCEEYGPPEKLVVKDIPSPALGKGQVRIQVHAAGVNFPDTLIIEGKYQFKPEPPFSPGGEVAGVVTEVGEGVTSVKEGDRVLGMTGWGGFAEEVVVDQSRAQPFPDSIGFVEAAGFIMTYGTSYYALKDRAELKEGETLLVLGAAGGVGLAAVQIGKLMGARVIACASSQEKLELAKEFGADELINYAEGPFKDKVKELTGGRGADVIYDAVGGDAFDQATRCINWKGRLLIIGFASGRIPEFPVNLALLKGSSVVGVFYGRFKEEEPEASKQLIDELVEYFEQGKLFPHISMELPLDEAQKALDVMAARGALGKIMLVTEAGQAARS